MNEISNLSELLQPIYNYEINRGNLVVRIDKPAGSNCPLAIIFNTPLDFSGFINNHSLPPDVSTWTNHDRHYPLEKGYVCERTQHILAGPLNQK